MPLSSTCRNCGLSKTSDYYGEIYCKDCQDAVDKSRVQGIKDNVDLGAVKREALAERAHNVHNNRIDPRRPLSRADYWTAGDPTGAEPTS